MRDGKTPIVRCPDEEKFQALSEIDRPGIKVIANPGGTSASAARACTRPRLSFIPTI
jgi:cyclohexadienyl dehydratase